MTYTRFNLAKELETPEVKRFEQAHGNRPLADVPMKNFVDATTGLLATKVSATFIRGALDAASFWQDLIEVVQLSSPIEEIPIISQRDFAIRTGRMPKTGIEESGGKLTKARLDTTNEDKIRYAYLQIREDDVRQRSFDLVERSIFVAGQAFSRHILDDIIAHYISVAGNSQALSSDKYFVAVAKAIALNKADGFGCTAIVIDSDDFVQAITEETAGGTMPWLLQLQNGTPLGDNFGNGVGQDGLSGKLFGRIPVYQVAANADLTGNILCLDGKAASVLGFAPGGDFKLSQEVNSMHDLVEAKIQAKYDYANANANAVAKVTGT